MSVGFVNSLGRAAITPLAGGGTGVALSDPNADRIVFWDDSAGEVAWLSAGSGLVISGTTLSVNIVSGDVLQVVQTLNNTRSSTTAIIPADDTKPQNTEGVEIMTVSITPLSSSSTLYVSAFVAFSGTQVDSLYPDCTAAIFKDSGVDALSAFLSRNRLVDNYAMMPLQVFYTEASTNTNARTFKLRVGTENGQTMYINRGVNSVFDGIVYSLFTVMEVA